MQIFDKILSQLQSNPQKMQKVFTMNNKQYTGRLHQACNSSSLNKYSYKLTVIIVVAILPYHRHYTYYAAMYNW